MSFSLLAGLLFRIIFMAALGFGMRRRGLMDDDFQKKLSAILLGVVIPLNILAVGNSSYDAQMAQNLIWAGIATALYYVVGAVICIFVSRRVRFADSPPASAAPRPRQNLLANCMLLANVGYIGIPIITEVYGAEGALYAVIFNLGFQFTAFTLGTKLMGGELTLRRFFTSPMTLSPLIAILIFVSPFRLPAFLVTAFSEVGGLSAAFSMFIIGSSLGKIKISTLFTGKYAWLVFAVRQLLFPAAAAAILYAAGLSGVLAGGLVMLIGMPSATLNVIFAEQYDQDIPFATRCVVLGTLLMVVTLPAWIFICQRLFF